MDIATDSRLVTRLEIVDTGRRRRWSEEEKRRIVEESYSAPRQASATARRHGISNQLLFAWRKAHREGGLGDGQPLRFRASDARSRRIRAQNRLVGASKW